MGATIVWQQLVISVPHAQSLLVYCNVDMMGNPANINNTNIPINHVLTCTPWGCKSLTWGKISGEKRGRHPQRYIRFGLCFHSGSDSPNPVFPQFAQGCNLLDNIPQINHPFPCPVVLAKLFRLVLDRHHEHRHCLDYLLAKNMIPHLNEWYAFSNS